MEHWLEREIAQWVHPMKDRSDDPSHHEQTLLPRSYISLLISGRSKNIYTLSLKKFFVFSCCLFCLWVFYKTFYVLFLPMVNKMSDFTYILSYRRIHKIKPGDFESFIPKEWQVLGKSIFAHYRITMVGHVYRCDFSNPSYVSSTGWNLICIRKEGNILFNDALSTF